MADLSTDLTEFPGGDLVAQGLADLSSGVLSEEALAVLVAGTRLRGLGFDVVDPGGIPRPIEHVLYSRIEERLGRGAHHAYNALIARLVSFAESYGMWRRRSQGSGLSDVSSGPAE